MPASRKISCVLAALLGACASVSIHAAPVHEQTLDSWTRARCSPCGTGALNFRMYGSFALSADTLLNRGVFAVLDHTIAGRDDLSISIWDAPGGTILYSADFADGSYVQRGSESTHFAIIDLPDWSLAAGNYWVSLFGINGNYIGWGTDAREGNDAHYRADGTLASDQRYVGFSLFGEEPPPAPVPLPGTLSLLLGGLAALGLFAKRRARH